MMLKLYDKAYPELKAKQRRFAAELARAFGDDIDIEAADVCNTREAVDDAIRGFERADADAIIVLFLTYAPSMIAAPALLRTPIPKILFNTQKLEALDPGNLKVEHILENHGMHGVQDLANVLRRSAPLYDPGRLSLLPGPVRPGPEGGGHGGGGTSGICAEGGAPYRGFEIVTGPWQDAAVRADVVLWAKVAKIAKDLRRCRIGMFGAPFEGMGDFGLDETAFRMQVGPEIVRVPLTRLASLAASAPGKALREAEAELRRNFDVDPKIGRADMVRSLKLLYAFRKIASDEKLDALTLNFVSFGESGICETVPFLAASMMLADGYGYGGEGDAASAACVYMMGRLRGPADFTEMFSMDFAGGRIYMAHMAECNWRMGRPSERPRLILREFKYGECKPYVALRQSCRPGPVTLANLTTGPGGRFQLIAARAGVEDVPPVAGQDTPHFFLRPAGDLCGFLSRYSEAGGSHHLAMVFGDAVEPARRLARLTGWPFCAVA